MYGYQKSRLNNIYLSIIKIFFFSGETVQIGDFIKIKLTATGTSRTKTSRNFVAEVINLKTKDKKIKGHKGFLFW